MFRFLAHFLLTPKLNKFAIVQKPPKTSKIEPQGASKLDFGAFWEPFWHTFSELLRYFYEKGENRADIVIPHKN